MHTYDVPHWTAQDEQDFVRLCEEAGFGNSFTLDLEVANQTLNPKIFPICPRSPLRTKSRKARKIDKPTRAENMRKSTAVSTYYDLRLNHMPTPPEQFIDVAISDSSTESRIQSRSLRRTFSKTSSVATKATVLTGSSKSAGKRVEFRGGAARHSRTTSIHSTNIAPCSSRQTDVAGNFNVSEPDSVVTSDRGHIFGPSTLHGQSSAHFGDAYHVHHHHHHHEKGNSSKATALSAASGAIVGGSLVGAAMATLYRADSSASSSVASTISTISSTTIDSVFSTSGASEPSMIEDDFELPELTPQPSKQSILENGVETVEAIRRSDAHDLVMKSQYEHVPDVVKPARAVQGGHNELLEISDHEPLLAQDSDLFRSDVEVLVPLEAQSSSYDTFYSRNGPLKHLSNKAFGKQPVLATGPKDLQPELGSTKRNVSRPSDLWTGLNKSLDQVRPLIQLNPWPRSDQDFRTPLERTLHSCFTFDAQKAAWNCRHEDRLQRAFKGHLGKRIDELLHSGAVLLPTAPVELHEVLARYLGENKNLSVAKYLLEAALAGRECYDVNTAYATNVLGTLYCVRGQADKAVKLHSCVLQQLPQTNSELRCSVLHRLGVAYAYQAVSVALDYLWPALFGMITLCGASNLSVFYMLRDIVLICHRAGRYEEVNTAIDGLLQTLKEESQSSSSTFPAPRKLANPRNLTFAQLSTDEVFEILDELRMRKVEALRELRSSMSEQDYVNRLREFEKVLEQITSCIYVS